MFGADFTLKAWELDRETLHHQLHEGHHPKKFCIQEGAQMTWSCVLHLINQDFLSLLQFFFIVRLSFLNIYES